MIESRNARVDYQFESFFELSADLLCIAGFDGYFKRINPSVSKLLEYSDEELFSKPINAFVHPDDVEITTNGREGLKKNNPLLNFENRYITKSGETVWLSWTSMPSYENKLVFAIAKNITYKKRLEQERNQLIANITRDNKYLKQFTFTTAHDLRSPVNNFVSILNLLDFSKIRDKETIEALELLKLASGQLQQTLNKRVDTLIQKDHLNIETEELFFSNVLNEVLSSIHTLILNSEATITCDFSKLEKIRFNNAYLQSVFLNLITNSIKYKKPDCPPRICIYTQIVNGVNQLIISDNGLGFDMNLVRDKVFGLYQKFHNHTDSKGIGLYLVYNHITSLGGDIAMESKVNEGTKFVISFKN
jgi:PAS domain S-box-containing protein